MALRDSLNMLSKDNKPKTTSLKSSLNLLKGRPSPTVFEPKRETPTIEQPKPITQPSQFTRAPLDYSGVKPTDIFSAPKKPTGFEKFAKGAERFSEKVLDVTAPARALSIQMDPSLGLITKAQETLDPSAKEERLRLEKEYPKLSTTGEFAGYILPGVGASKAAGKGVQAASKYLPKLAKGTGLSLGGLAAAEGIAGAGMGAVEEFARGDEGIYGGNMGKGALYGGLLGAGMTGVLGGIGKGISKTRQGLSEALESPFKGVTDFSTTPRQNILKQPITPFSKTARSTTQGVRSQLDIPQVGKGQELLSEPVTPFKAKPKAGLIDAKEMIKTYTDEQIFDINRPKIEAAKTGEPIELVGMRYTKPSGTKEYGDYFAINRNYANIYDPKTRGDSLLRAGDDDLFYKNIRLENPLVINSDIGDFKDQLSLKLMGELNQAGNANKANQIANQLDNIRSQNWEISRDVEANFDKLLKESAEELGYDGMIMQKKTIGTKGNKLFPEGNASEVIDFGAQKKKPKIQTEPSYNKYKTVKDLPDNVDELSKIVNDMEIAQSKGIPINLQLFAEAKSKLTNLRKTIGNSVLGADVIPEETKKVIQKRINEAMYEPVGNKLTWNEARAKVSNNAREALEDFRTSSKAMTEKDTALGQALIVDAVQKGDHELASDIAFELAEKLTDAGRAVQAMSILKRLSPEGMLVHANKTLKKVFNNLDDATKKKLNPKDFKLNQDESKKVADLMDIVSGSGTQREKDIAMAQVAKLVSDKIPPSMREKVRAYQRINLLLNPKTMIRNVAGNVIMTGVKNVKDVIRAGVEAPLSKLTGVQRTTAFPSLKKQLKGGIRGFKETIEDAKLGIDTSNMPTKAELDTMRTSSPFKNPVLRKLDDMTRVGLKFGDSPFYQAAYDDSIAQQLKAAKTNVVTPEMKDLAENVAKEVTFQDVNKVTELFDGMHRLFNKIPTGIKGFGLGDIIIPFKRTPANILKRGIEYSPINFINVVGDSIRLAKDKNAINQYKLVDNLAKSLTGTGLLLAGMYLADKGIINPAAPSDYDAASFKREQGILPYSFNVGDKTVAYDWAQPASIPLAMGADINESMKSKGDYLGKLERTGKGLLSGADTLFSQPLIQGITRFMNSRDSKGMLDKLAKAGLDGALQLLPLNSMGRQIAELTDPVDRATTTDSMLESTLNRAAKSYPLTRQLLPEKTLTTGEARESRPIFDVLLNPANVGKQKMTDAKREVIRLYEESGEKVQFPRIADKSIKPKKEGKRQFEEVNLNNKQRADFQKILGTSTMKEFDRTIDRPSYIKADDVKKAQILQKIINKQNALAKREIIDKYDLKKEIK